MNALLAAGQVDLVKTGLLDECACVLLFCVYLQLFSNNTVPFLLEEYRQFSASLKKHQKH